MVDLKLVSGNSTSTVVPRPVTFKVRANVEVMEYIQLLPKALNEEFLKIQKMWKTLKQAVQKEYCAIRRFTWNLSSSDINNLKRSAT